MIDWPFDLALAAAAAFMYYARSVVDRTPFYARYALLAAVGAGGLCVLIELVNGA